MACYLQKSQKWWKILLKNEIKRGLLANGATRKLSRFKKNNGNLIEDDDIFIGATALENDAILVTNNERHLGRIKNLKYEVWK